VPNGEGKSFQTEAKGPTMILTTGSGLSVDTEKDLTAAERHIIQKLLFWEDLALSVEQFREKVSLALQKGWNHSGPVAERPVVRELIKVMEEKVRVRLKKAGIQPGDAFP
jgi:hypothetical protein